MELKGEKVLVVGLGGFGGGVATMKWLAKQGAILTVTDLRTRAELGDSIRALGSVSKKIKLVLGEHRLQDFKNSNLIVVGPGVKLIGNNFLATAKKKGIPIVNDLLLFLENAKNPIVAITGTRGKTTTTNWTAHFLRAKYKKMKASGNSSNDAFLKLLLRLAEDKKTPAVLEISSFQLEGISTNLLQDNSVELSGRGPDVAVITNLYRDHLNRHETMRNYALAKANIFKNQTKKQALILNYDNPWTRFFLSQKPKAKVFFISLYKNPPTKHFLIRANKKIVLEMGKRKGLSFRGK